MKEWFSSKELTNIEGMPTTTQGINRKARAQKWTSRKRSGARGKALEYYIGSFPRDVKDALMLEEKSAAYVMSPVEPLQIWMTFFKQLSKDEQKVVTSWLMRNGIKDFIAFISSYEKDN